MTETNIETTNVVPSPFSEENWKSEPSVIMEETKVDPAIEEKDQKIKEEKPESDKPNEPEKIPGASPKPIQDRPSEEIQTKEVLVFANEESEKLFNLILGGKLDEAREILNEQKKLSEVDKLPPADIIKLNLQYQNKEFSQEDINDLFSEKYAMPEQPIQRDDELDEDFEARVNKHQKEVQKIEKRIARDAKPASAELLKLHKEIVLPDIPKPEQKMPEPTQEELDAQKANIERFLQNVEEGLKSFKGYEATFKDEEVELKVAYPLTDEERKEIQPLLALSNTDAGAFLRGLGWLDEKGNINTAKLTEDLPFILNKEKVLNKMVSETGNQRYAAAKKAIKNIDYSGVSTRSNGDVGATPEQLQTKMVKHFWGN